MTLTPAPEGFWVRLRYGKGQRDRFLIKVDPLLPPDAREALALDAERKMGVMARQLARAAHPKAFELLVEAGRVASDANKFRALQHAVDQVASELEQAPSAPRAPTFREIALAWTSGALAERFPDEVAPKVERSRKQDMAILTVFFPVLGHRPLSEITTDETDQAIALIPRELDSSTRGIYISRLRFVFERLAMGPLRLLDRSPVRAFAPRKKKRSLFWFLYPQEEAKLLGFRKIPLAYRILYGWLARNGSRISETLQLTWDHLDLAGGSVRLEAEWTKTRRARVWSLEPDVTRALRRWHEHDERPAGDARVFHSATGQRLNRSTVHKRFLSDLLLAGVTREELHVSAGGARQLRVHDLRSTFVTLALRLGRPLPWIMDRSGHESVAVLEKYRRFARHADEQNLPAWFEDLDRAIPEFRPGPALGKAPTFYAGKTVIPQFAPDGGDEPNTQEIQTKPASVSPETPPPAAAGPASFPWVGQSGPGQAEVLPETTEAALVRIEESLAADLKALIAAGRYELADKVMAELRERRLQRTAPAVTQLSDARAKRKNGDKT